MQATAAAQCACSLSYQRGNLVMTTPRKSLAGVGSDRPRRNEVPSPPSPTYLSLDPFSGESAKIRQLSRFLEIHDFESQLIISFGD